MSFNITQKAYDHPASIHNSGNVASGMLLLNQELTRICSWSRLKRRSLREFLYNSKGPTPFLKSVIAKSQQKLTSS